MTTRFFIALFSEFTDGLFTGILDCMSGGQETIY